ncbi:MAG: diaminopimelate epimerase, partial [Ruminococcaceae bacterium]|nr:diaminopimelate epimerase [Oscillospiraceae bacterium]
CKNIPVLYDGSNVNIPVTGGGRDYLMTCVSMGNPHAVIFVENPDDIPLEEVGPLFENSVLFPDKVNTEFASVISRNHLNMRVWERGSGETLACGTGACAVAVAAVLTGLCDMDTDITVTLRGGDLVINYKSDGTVTMTGGAATVFCGSIEL